MVHQNSIFAILVSAHTFCALRHGPTNSGLPPVTKIFLIMGSNRLVFLLMSLKFKASLSLFKGFVDQTSAHFNDLHHPSQAPD